jgi:hypothetical protein
MSSKKDSLTLSFTSHTNADTVNYNQDEDLNHYSSTPPSHSVINFSTEMDDLHAFHDRYQRYTKQAIAVLSPLPAQRSTIRKRIGALSLLSLRRTLVYLIYTNTLTVEQGDQLSPLFKVLGIEGVSNELFYLLTHAPILIQREQALAAIFHSTKGQSYFENLSEFQRIELSGPWIRPMMRIATIDTFPRFAIAALYHSTADYARADLLQRFEECRQEVNADPIYVYEILWQRPIEEHLALYLLETLYTQQLLPEYESMISKVHSSLHVCLRTIYEHCA